MWQMQIKITFTFIIDLGNCGKQLTETALELSDAFYGLLHGLEFTQRE